MDKANYTQNQPENQSYSRNGGKYFFALVFLLAFHLIFNSLWIFLNKTPPTWDSALHTYLSIRYFDYLFNNPSIFRFTEFLSISTYYPPFVHLVGSILHLAGKGYKAIQFSGTLFFILSILFIYLYTKEIFKNKQIAFFSAFFFSFFITIYQQSRYHMLDIPLTAMIFGALYFLEKSKSLTDRKNIFLFFLFSGLTFLTKWYGLIFISIPALFYLYEAFQKKSITKKAVINLSLGFIIFLTLIAPWYGKNFYNVLDTISTTSAGELADPQRIFSLENLLFYLKLFIIFQFSFVGSIFLLVSLILLFLKGLDKKTRIVLVTIVITYLVFTFIGNKNIRYLIPAMPFFAIVMGYGFYDILKRGKTLLIFFSSLVISYYVLSYFILSFGAPIYPQYKYAINFPVLGWTDVYYLHNYPVKVIYDEPKLPYEQILKDVLTVRGGGVRVLLLADSDYINNGILNPYLYEELESRKNNILFIGYDRLEDKNTDNQMNNFLDREVDVVLLAEKYIGLPEGIREYQSVERFRDFVLSGRAQDFTEVNKYYLQGDEYHPPKDKLIFFKKE